MVRSSTELLYWVQFRDLIHYVEASDSYVYDDNLPQRARDSFEMWLKQRNS